MSKKKRYIVVPRTEGVKASGLKTGKRHLKFGTQTATWIDDPAEAKEIDTQYGLKGSGDVWVEQDENLEWHDHHDGNTDGRKVSIHHYTFSGVDMKGIRTTRDNGYVWAWVDGRQKRMRREEAEREGYEIIKANHEKLRQKVYAQNPA